MLAMSTAWAAQAVYSWSDHRRFDGRSQHVMVPHDPAWVRAEGTLVLDFTADRVKGVQGLLSKDARGHGDGGHLLVWLEEGAVVARLQDKQADFLVRSGKKAVVTGVPVRLALVFGKGGMRLYLDGKAVGTNSHAGGLIGNEEPLVIGARDWLSAPRTAGKPDAFFAGTVGAVALYDAPLDAPAIAALGAAGSALAQAVTPATSTPVTLGVEIVESQTLNIRPEGLARPEDLGRLVIQIVPPQEQGQSPTSPFQIRSGASLALQPWRDEVQAVAMLQERARRAAGSSEPDDLHAALFVELVKAAFKAQKSSEELRALEWWARVAKIKRIQAGEGAIKAYDDWRMGRTAPRTARGGVLLGDDKVNQPSLQALLASGFEQVSGPATDAANRTWPKVVRRLQAEALELQKSAAGDDTQAILDGVVTTLSLLKDGFTGWTTVAATAYTIASNRWRQVHEANEMPGKLAGFLTFAKTTTPSLTESLFTEEGAKQVYVALIASTL